MSIQFILVEKMSCIKEGCKEPKTVNAYCKKHKVYFLIEEDEKRGQRICSNVILGCREVNDLTYTKKKCETCLENERIRDRPFGQYKGVYTR